ncbi:hypothetical protein PQ465_11370 [Sphingobacterium oryzagri]|uniref:Uncharacterized protein n=1 Tax=Sphingobacterium oryzagri TaxID=3025669 RepID=A0ABY7WBS5_9SPHI|nr:hypothetical protein [Sphingobacterium sp. KACC 22765]WDF66905.1 hypothetical protein PQ465_11370 [Sphingobacterium sp. KACC 22765]
MRKARRLYKQAPVFAFELLRQEYEGYAEEDFLDDLRIRSKPLRVKKGKSPLRRYGRYQRMQKFVDLFARTGNIAYGLQAQRLRDMLHVPYRVVVIISAKTYQYRCSPLIRIEDIEGLVAKLSACGSESEAGRLVEEFNHTSELL